MFRYRGQQDWIDERSSKPTCAELIGDGADEAVYLFEAEDDMVLIGEITLLALSVCCGERANLFGLGAMRIEPSYDDTRNERGAPRLGNGHAPSRACACAPGFELAWAWDRI